MVEHRRTEDEQGGNHGHTRAPDFWQKLDILTSRFKLVYMVWLVFLGIGAIIGSRVIQPLQKVAAIDATLKELVARLNALILVDEKMGVVVVKLVHVRCLELGAADRIKLDMDCTNILLPDVAAQVRQP